MTRGEAPERLLRAGLSTFAERGYARSSTRDIADAAGVSESLLYRHFGSKAKLFERAVLEPFERLVATYVEGIPPDDARGEPHDVCGRSYVEWLYDLLSRHRELIMALLAAQAYEVDLSDTPELSAALDRLQAVAEVELTRRGLSGVEVTSTIPLTFAMVFALAVFDSWLLPQQNRPSRGRIVEEMVRVTAHGLARSRPHDKEPPIAWSHDGNESED